MLRAGLEIWNIYKQAAPRRHAFCWTKKDLCGPGGHAGSISLQRRFERRETLKTKRCRSKKTRGGSRLASTVPGS